MLIFGDKIAFGTRQQLLRLDVLFRVIPELLLTGGHKLTLLAFVFAILTAATVDSGVRRVNTFVAIFVAVLFEDSIAGPTFRWNFRMEVSNVSFEAPFSSGGIVTIRALMVEMGVHMGIELTFRCTRIGAEMTSVKFTRYIAI